MFKLLPLSFAASLLMIQDAYSHEGHSEKGHYVEISTDKLKTVIENEKGLFLIDARPSRYDDGFRIPGTLSLSFDASEEEIQEKLPHKNGLIVLYCGTKKCPTSRFLADRLVMMGYDNVYRYSGGLEEWRKAKLPLVSSNEN